MIYSYIAIALILFIVMVVFRVGVPMTLGKKFLWALAWPLTALGFMVLVVYLLWGKKR